MKRIILFFGFFSFALIGSAQQLPLYSEYLMNNFLLNPAIAGSVYYTPLKLTARQQWMGIEGAPSTQALSIHTLLRNRKMGMGGYFFNDRFGPISSTGMQFSYSYHLTLNRIDSKLGMGLSVSAFQFVLDETKLTLYEEKDMVITYNKESVVVPDANFGLYLYSRRYFVSFSAAQLFQWTINIKGEHIDNNQLVRHYFLSAGYIFRVSQSVEVEPSFLLKTTEYSPVQADINVKGIIKKHFWFGVSYRHQDAVVVMTGFNVKRFSFGYAYDYTLSKIMNVTDGSHEVMIGYNIGEKIL